MIVRTEVKTLFDKVHGEITMTISYDENNVPVKSCQESKDGARFRVEIMNPERWHPAMKNLDEYYSNKMKTQSDETLKIFEDYTARNTAD